MVIPIKSTFKLCLEILSQSGAIQEELLKNWCYYMTLFNFIEIEI